MAHARPSHETPVWASPNIVAIDPGKRAAFAVMTDGDLAESKTVDGDDLRVVAAIVAQFLPVLDRTVFVVERQFLKRGGASNPRALETLLWRRHMWEVVLDIHGGRRVRVHPSTWQSEELAIAPRIGVGGKLTTKQRANLACRHWWPGVDLVEDEADAALMARWYWNQQRMRGL